MLVANMTRQIEDVINHNQFRQPFRDDASINVQERAFTQWCNLFLKSKGFEINNLLELEDGVCIIILLEIVSGQNLYNVEIDDSSEVSRNWQLILNHLENENVQIPEVPEHINEDSRKLQLLTFIIWRIILRYQILDHNNTTSEMKQIDYKRASQSLLKWVRARIPNYPISNFSSDWTDGVAFCYLVNAIRPDTIPESMFRHTNNPEMNVRLACTRAEDELAIPELIAHYDIANGRADEKSIMTYVALFRSADRMIRRGIKTKTYTSDVSVTSESESEFSSSDSSRKSKTKEISGIPYQPARCVAFGAGLRWGQVGKPAEFIVRLNGAEASELSVSIECRPYDHRAALYKPELQIKPISETSYIVRYTPTRPGVYVLSIFCSGDHIPGSPFRLSVQETVLLAKQYHGEEIIINTESHNESLTAANLTKCLQSSYDEVGGKRLASTDSHHDSAFVDDDGLSSCSSTPPPWLDQDSHALYTKLSRFLKPDNISISAYGEGLHVGTVGKVCSFNVATPNSDRGPLSVSITCPAMSIPVPCVKTKLQPGFLLHDVLYLPTEPGVYEVEVKWGEAAIPGSPFRLAVDENPENEVNDERELDLQSNRNKIKLHRCNTKHNIFIYYSATTKRIIESQNKTELQKLLQKENPSDEIITVPIDIEMTSSERKTIFDKANSKLLPLVFANDVFIGNFNDIMSLYRKGGLKESIKTYFSKVKTQFHRLSSSTSDYDYMME